MTPVLQTCCGTTLFVRLKRVAAHRLSHIVIKPVEAQRVSYDSNLLRHNAFHAHSYQTSCGSTGFGRCSFALSPRSESVYGPRHFILNRIPLRELSHGRGYCPRGGSAVRGLSPALGHEHPPRGRDGPGTAIHMLRN